MQRYVVLLKFTDTGIREVNDSPARANRFRTMAEKAGVTIESALWTLGEFDGVLQFSAPDEQTAVALVLNLHKDDNVHTRMLRAFDAQEFEAILGKVQ